MLLMKLFRQYGRTAEITNACHEAVEYLQKQIPTSVMLDFMMPDMEELEFCSSELVMNVARRFNSVCFSAVIKFGIFKIQ